MDILRIDCRDITGDDIGRSEQIQRAYDCVVKHGYAILDGVVPVAAVRALHAEFESSYARYIDDREQEETLKIGNRRFMVPLELSGGFADPLVYGNPFVLALVREALDHDAVLDNFGAVVSLSGARMQHFHRDAGLLFDSAISAVLPAHALNVVLPLVEMNDQHGTTALWPGSHRWKTKAELKETMQPLVPTIPLGSAMVWDYRLFHRGTANVSPQARPMIYGTYARCWYRDAANFSKETQRRLWLNEDFVKGIPEDRRALFARVA